MMNGEVLTAQKVEAQPAGLLLWVSFAVCFLCNLSAGLVSTLMAAYLPPVVQDLNSQAGAGEMGTISAYIQALFIGGWAAGGFFWGFISDRIGRVRALALSVGLFGLFTFFVAFASSWEQVVALRLLAGLTVGGILVITPTLLFEIWPKKSRAVMIGIDSIGFPVGIFSSGLVTVLVADWRDAFVIGLLPLALGVLALLALKESAHWVNRAEQRIRGTSTPGDRANLVRGSLIFGSMLIGLWGMFSWIPTWVQSLLVDSDGQNERGIAMMLLGAGGLCGGFASGWISNTLGVRRSMMFCFAGCIGMSGWLFGLHDTFSTAIYFQLALLSFFFGVSQGLLSIYIPQLFPVQIRGTFTGICFNTGRVVTAIAIFFVGALVTFFNGYGNTLLAFAGIFVIGFVTMLLSRTTKT